LAPGADISAGSPRAPMSEMDLKVHDDVNIANPQMEECSDCESFDEGIFSTSSEYIEFEPLNKGRLEPLKLTIEDAKFIDSVRQLGFSFGEIHEYWYDPGYTRSQVTAVHRKFRHEIETFTPGDVRELESIIKKQFQKAWNSVARQMGKSMRGCKRIAKEKDFSLF
jgi:hypothetical protein